MLLFFSGNVLPASSLCDMTFPDFMEFLIYFNLINLTTQSVCDGVFSYAVFVCFLLFVFLNFALRTLRFTKKNVMCVINNLLTFYNLCSLLRSAVLHSLFQPLCTFFILHGNLRLPLIPISHLTYVVHLFLYSSKVMSMSTLNVSTLYSTYHTVLYVSRILTLP